jgi:23S rRNA (uracil1939-C5)-methyltransferase
LKGYFCRVGRKKITILEDLLITDYAAEGKALARLDGKVVFVEGAVPGDRVNVRLYKNKKDWAEGFVTSFSGYSEDRVEPFCSHFGVCGGCVWQMLPYEKQLEYKQQQVVDNLTRIGKVELPPIQPIRGADAQVHYRNKIEYTFGTKRFLRREELNRPDIDPHQPVAGFHAKGVFDKVVDVDNCYLQAEPTNAIRKAIKAYALEKKYPFYDIRMHQGWLRTMMVRLCETGEIMVNIVVGYQEPEWIEDLLQHAAAQFPHVTTWLYTVNTKRNDSIFDLEPVVWKGKGYVEEQLEDFRFKIGPKSFFQTNTRQGTALYQITREFAELSGTETVYDLYCGTGSIGIFLSKKAGKIIGVEVIPEAVEDAKQNAAMNGIQNGVFVAGDAAKICDDAFFLEHGRPDVIITDPPRAGMHEQLVLKILELEAPIVVYVSCNPATQARDLRLLSEKYQVSKVQPVDMFPHTHHIENVVQLILKR